MNAYALSAPPVLFACIFEPLPFSCEMSSHRSGLNCEASGPQRALLWLMADGQSTIVVFAGMRRPRMVASLGLSRTVGLISKCRYLRFAGLHS